MWEHTRKDVRHHTGTKGHRVRLRIAPRWYSRCLFPPEVCKRSLFGRKHNNSFSTPSSARYAIVTNITNVTNWAVKEAQVATHSLIRTMTTTLRSAGLLLFGAAFLVEEVVADCLANAEFNQFFENVNGGATIPLEGSCCQKDVCNLPCPEPVADPTIGKFVFAWIGSR